MVIAIVLVLVQVARTSDFLNCDIGLLTSVLAQHDLVVHDEMTLYTSVR